MGNAGLDDSQTGIKVAGRNIMKLRRADHTTLMAETEEELKNFLLRVKEEDEKAGLKLNIQKTKIMVSCPITLWQIDEENMETKVHIVKAMVFSVVTYRFERWTIKKAES